jgi:hypothetical protein
VIAGVVALLAAAACSVALAISVVLVSSLLPILYSWRMAKSRRENISAVLRVADLR